MLNLRVCKVPIVGLALLSSFLVLFSLRGALEAEEKEAKYQVNYEESVKVPIEEFLSKELLKGKGYTLDPQVIIYRSVGLYGMETPYGRSTVIGTSHLLERIDELNAVTQLEAMKGTEVYAKALKNSALGPIETAKNLVTAPIDTVSRIGRGIGGFFADIGYSMVSDDPDQENVAKTALGFATAKRQYAYELGVNPYSDFQPLQDELSEVAWTATGGGLTVSVGFAAIGGTAGTVLSTTKTANSMRKLVRDNSPRKLKNLNFDKLKAMGVEESLAEAFLDNFNYDPETETRLVGALESMKNVAGRGNFIKRAALVQNKVMARRMREWAELFDAYHNEVEKVKGIVIVRGAPVLQVKDDSIFVLLPTDYLTWTPNIEKRGQAVVDELKAKGLKQGKVWLTGKIEPKMKEMLLAQGWTSVTQRVESKLLTE